MSPSSAKYYQLPPPGNNTDNTPGNSTDTYATGSNTGNDTTGNNAGDAPSYNITGGQRQRGGPAPLQWSDLTSDREPLWL